MTNLRNLGQIATRLRQAVVAEHQGYDDLGRFYAPGACYRDLRQAARREHVKLVEQLEAATGYSAEELVAEFQRRCGAKFLYVTSLLDPLDAVIQQREDDETDRVLRQYANRSRLPGAELAA